MTDQPMPERFAPNPLSEWATAAPHLRHVVPSFFNVSPVPGSLAPTACRELAVVPDEPPRDLADYEAAVSLGLCPLCVAAVEGRLAPDTRPRCECLDCGSETPHGGICVLCRQDAQDSDRASGATTRRPSQVVPGTPEPLVGESSDEKYPCQIAVFCDVCDTVRTGDYVVSDAMSGTERLAAARRHLVANEGWEHTNGGNDYCPAHVTSVPVERR